MKKIVREGERKILLDSDKDECLWDGHAKKNEAGFPPNRWLELYVHEYAAAQPNEMGAFEGVKCHKCGETNLRRSGEDAQCGTCGTVQPVPKERAAFYLFHRTQWQGETNYIEPLTMDEAQKFAEEHIDDLLECVGTDRLNELGLIDMEALE